MLGIFANLLICFDFCCNQIQILNTLHEDLHIFMAALVTNIIMVANISIGPLVNLSINVTIDFVVIKVTNATVVIVIAKVTSFPVVTIVTFATDVSLVAIILQM